MITCMLLKSRVYSGREYYGKNTFRNKGGVKVWGNNKLFVGVDA